MLTNANGWKEFVTLCEKASKSGQLNDLLSLLLTIEEREQLATRILLVKELSAKKLTQREIAAKLGISIAKITRGSNALKQITPNIQQLIHSYFADDQSSWRN